MWILTAYKLLRIHTCFFRRFYNYLMFFIFARLRLITAVAAAAKDY